MEVVCMSVSNSFSNPAFKGIYKVNMPDIRTIQDEKEKTALAETMVNTLVLGSNFSVTDPRVAKDDSAVYFKIDDKNDAAFEAGFKTILDECNKQFNMDLAKKVYYNKADEAEFNKAEELK